STKYRNLGRIGARSQMPRSTSNLDEPRVHEPFANRSVRPATMTVALAGPQNTCTGDPRSIFQPAEHAERSARASGVDDAPRTIAVEPMRAVVRRRTRITTGRAAAPARRGRVPTKRPDCGA